MTKVNIREALNEIDKNTFCKYDLLNLYEACNFNYTDKCDIAKLLSSTDDAEVIYDKLSKKLNAKESENLTENDLGAYNIDCVCLDSDDDNWEDLEEGSNISANDEIELYYTDMEGNISHGPTDPETGTIETDTIEDEFSYYVPYSEIRDDLVDILEKDSPEVYNYFEDSEIYDYIDSHKDELITKYDAQLKDIHREDATKEFEEMEYEKLSYNPYIESLDEDVVKTSKGKWVNKGEEGTHGTFDTKKEADAQRKAMFASGYKGESLDEKLNLTSHDNKNHIDESLNEGLSPEKGDRVRMDHYTKLNNGQEGTVTGRIGELCWVTWDDGTKSKEIKGYLTVIEREGKVVNESATDPRYYKMVEYNYDGDDISNYLGHVRVRTNSDKVALRAAQKYAMSKHPEDNPGHFKIVDDNYTNVDVVDSDGDYLTTLESVDESKSIKEDMNDPDEVLTFKRDVNLANDADKIQLSEAYPDDEYEYMDVESDFDDSGVRADDSFIEDGNEYTFIERVGGVVHLDFDNWAVWSARNEDTGEINFFIVDEDTGFIDWGPVDTSKEAIEFLQSKIDDYNQDESLVENSGNIPYNINEDASKEFINLPSFTKRWKELGLNDEDYRELQNLIVKGIHADPLGTDCYKIRFSPSRLNKGKNTSSRIIYIDFIEKGNVYFATAFSKSDEADITKTELADIRELSKLLQGA